MEVIILGILATVFSGLGIALFCIGHDRAPFTDAETGVDRYTKLSLASFALSIICAGIAVALKGG